MIEYLDIKISKDFSVHKGLNSAQSCKLSIFIEKNYCEFRKAQTDGGLVIRFKGNKKSKNILI